MSTSNIEPTLPPVVAGKKRKFTPQMRTDVITYYDALPEGQKGAYLRRNGLYDTTIAEWRKLADGMTHKQGRKPLTDESRELRKLRADNARLTKELERANAVIEVQKKVTGLLESLSETKERS